MHYSIATKYKQNIICLIGCILTVLTLNMDLSPQEAESGYLCLVNSMKSIQMFNVILLPLLYRFYKHTLDLTVDTIRSLRARLTAIIPSALFAFFMVMGFSFFMTNSWDYVFISKVQLLKSLIAFGGYFALFYFSINCLYHYTDHLDLLHKETDKKLPIFQWYLNALRKYPFRTCFLTLLAAYIPYMILSYPGIISNDSRRQIMDTFHYFQNGKSMENQHPVFHSFFLYFCVTTGEGLLHSANAGVFLYSMIQAGLLFTAVSLTVKLLAELHCSNKILLLTILFFIVTPRTQNYLFLLAKDALFAPFLIICLVQLYRLATGTYQKPEHKKWHLLLFIITVAGVFFFRQDGIYILLILFVMAFLLNRRNRKCWALFFVCTLLFSSVYQNVILPQANITPTSRSQLFSIPFQQTARCVKEVKDQITEEEAEAIAAILDYENLGELYNPNLSDPVKSTFNDDATSEDLANYFKVWFQMLLKYPDIYVQATMNNLYGYFYPDGHTANLYDYEKSAEKMEELNHSLSETYSLHFGYPARFTELRNQYELIRETFYKLPVLSLLLTPAFYTWTLLLWCFYCIRQKNKTAMLLSVPPITVLLVCMAGPTYGWYFRYLYSLTVCLPFVIAAGLHQIKSE